MKNQDAATESPRVIVIDVPAATPPEEAAAILAEPLSRGYYLKSMTAGEPMRCVFAQPVSGDTGKCEEELKAMGLVQAHKRETPTRIVQILCQNGIYRGTQWVNKTRDEL